MLQYTRDILLSLSQNDVTPSRNTRKSIFKHSLWLPAYERCLLQRRLRRWRTQSASSRRSSTPSNNPPLTDYQRNTSSDDTVLFGLLNAQSVGNKFFELRTTVVESRYDVLLLTETWHTSSDDTALRNCIPPGYICLDEPRPPTDIGRTNHGGVAAVISNESLKHHRIVLKIKTTTFEYLCFSVTGPAATVVVLLIYRPGSSEVTDAFFSELASVLELVALYKCQIIVAGDFNIHVESKSDVNAAKLHDLLQSFACVQQTPHVATHRDGGTLDLVVTKSDQVVEQLTVEPPGILSDHALVSWRLRCSRLPPIAVQRDVRNWNKVDWDEFREALLRSELCTSVGQLLDVNEYFAVYHDVLQSLADKFAPVRKITIRRQRLAPWMDAECRQLRRNSRRLERKYRRTKSPADRQVWVEHERHRHRVYRQKESSYWQAQLTDRSKQPKQLWERITALLGKSKGNGKQMNDSLPTADDLLKFFVEKVETIRNSTGGSSANTFLPTAPVVLDKFEPYSAEDIAKVIKAAPSKSCCLDPLPTNIMKQFLPELLPFITQLCNASLTHSCLPLSQRHALVTPRLKKSNADPADMKNYRPVSNLTFISKVIERLVCRQLVAFLEKNRLLPGPQSAYRSGRSTETAVLKIISDAFLAADRGEVTLLGLLDLSAAFDTVDHDILCNRLSASFGIRGSVLAWIKSFLHGRTQTVIFNGETSMKSAVSCGVPQGSVLGPILFLLYTADVIEIANRHGVNVHSYADDTQLYVHTPANRIAEQSSKLTACITDIESWMCSNRLKLNTEKTQFTVFGSRYQLAKITTTSVSLKANQIDISNEVICLGVVLDQELTFAAHVRRLSSRCFYQLRQLRTIRHSLNEQAAKNLVHAFVVARLDYCNSVLSGVTKARIKELQSVLNAAARLVVRLKKFDHITSTLRDVLHWLPIQQRIDFKVAIMAYRCLHGTGPDYLTEMLNPVATDPGRHHLRSAAHGDIIVPRTKTKTFGPRSFAARGPTVWNRLPPNMRDLDLSLGSFRRELKTFYYCRAYTRD